VLWRSIKSDVKLDITKSTSFAAVPLALNFCDAALTLYFDHSYFGLKP
jgi:hypothetical protein